MTDRTGANRRISPGTALGFTALLVALGSGAYAAIPDSAGVIHACFTKATGQLRVVDGEDPGAAACRRSETGLTWNQRGEKGEPGEKGDRGEPGPAGPQGPPGLTGYEIVTEVSNVSPVGPKNAGARCPEGKKVIGGGGIIGSPPGQHTNGVFLSDSGPTGDFGWSASAHEGEEQGANRWAVTAIAICAEVVP